VRRCSGRVAQVQAPRRSPRPQVNTNQTFFFYKKRYNQANKKYARFIFLISRF
jgi:hypothetical protein